MEEAIQLLVSGRDRSGVLELNLDNRFKGAKGAGAGTGRSPLAGFTRLATLSMNNVGLASLDGLFPSLAALRELELNDNRLTGGLEHLNRLSGLESLKLAGNQIATVEALKPLAKLRSLTSLDMIENPVTRQAGYRERVFAALPGLVVLDGVDREGNEVEMDDDDEEDDEDEEDDGEDEEGDTYRKIMAKPYGGPAVGRGEAKGVAGEGERDQGDDVDDEDMDDEEEDVEDEDDDPAVGDEEEEADDEEDYGEGGEDDDEEYGYDREGQGAQQRQVNEGEEEEDDGEDDDEDVEGGEYGEEDYEDDDEDVEDDITGQEVGEMNDEDDGNDEDDAEDDEPPGLSYIQKDIPPGESDEEGDYEPDEGEGDEQDDKDEDEDLNFEGSSENGGVKRKGPEGGFDDEDDDEDANEE